MNVATLVGDVMLRPPIPDMDGPIADAWYAKDPEGAWQVFLRRPDRNQQEVFADALANTEHRYWVIQVGMPVGVVRLSTKDRRPGVAALLYYIAPMHRGVGHGSRAVQMIVQHAFADLGFKTLLADVLIANTASARLLEKLGFERTGNRNLAESDRGPQELEEWRIVPAS